MTAWPAPRPERYEGPLKALAEIVAAARYPDADDDVLAAQAQLVDFDPSWWVPIWEPPLSDQWFPLGEPHPDRAAAVRVLDDERARMTRLLGVVPHVSVRRLRDLLPEAELPEDEDPRWNDPLWGPPVPLGPGRCSTHGIYSHLGCPGCPPVDGHELHYEKQAVDQAFAAAHPFGQPLWSWPCQLCAQLIAAARTDADPTSHPDCLTTRHVREWRGL